MKRIGLVTWTGWGNYGTILQAYSLYSFLESKGYECYIINPFNPATFGLKTHLRNIANKVGIEVLLEKRRISKWQDARKYYKVLEFKRKTYKVINVYTTKRYEKLLRDIDVFCVGSDQVWNAYFNFSPFNFLSFAGNDKRISYASSMGTSNFPSEYQEEIKQLLLKFSHISLREETGCDAVVKLTGRKDVKTVLDPTFLLTQKDWNDFGRDAHPEIELPERYVFVYLIGKNVEYVNQLEDLCQRIGVGNIVLIPAAENSDFKVDGANVYRYASPSDFVYLLAQSSWVCTDSFHATALSINLRKNFTEFLRFKDGDNVSQNSRIYDVLNTFGLQERLYNINKGDKWAKPINYGASSVLLENLRKDSIDWLINAIEN